MVDINKTIVAREGDFIETTEGLFFDVKGLIHPPDRTIAFLRYYPTPQGKRRRGNQRYDKVYHLVERFDYLRQHYPKYLYKDAVFGQELQGVQHSAIKHTYQPKESLRKLIEQDERDALQQDVVTFANILEQTARVSPNSLGISGSIQVNLHGETSDIDLIVYGRRAAQAVQLALRRAHLLPEEGISGYRLETYLPVYNLRWSGSGISIEKMLLVDGLKAMHGVFGGHHYFVRAVLEWDEVHEQYGDSKFRQLGRARAYCRIMDDRDGLFTPCRYEIEAMKLLEGRFDVEIREIVSFRGRFSEQVRQDEEAIVQGTVELVEHGKEKWGRFVLGSDPTDILLPKNVL